MRTSLVLITIILIDGTSLFGPKLVSTVHYQNVCVFKHFKVSGCLVITKQKKYHLLW